MSSLILPIGSWQRQPESKITCLNTTKDGSFVVTGYSSGLLQSYKWNEMRTMLIPLHAMFGHKTAITAISLCQLEVDSLTFSENIILSGSEDGEIAMWDLQDGRSLLNNPNAYSFYPTCIELSPSGRHIFVSGYGGLVILDAITLSVLSTFAERVFDIGVAPLGSSTVSIITAGDEVAIRTLNEGNYTLTTKCFLSLACKKIKMNLFDRNIFLCISNENCYIYTMELACLAEIHKPESDWTDGTFISSKTLLLWSGGHAFFFYLGSEDDLYNAQLSDISGGTILIADSKKAILTRDMSKNYANYSKTTCIAMFEDRNASLICIPPSPRSLIHNLVHFTSQHIHYSPFVANSKAVIQMISSSHIEGNAIVFDIHSTSVIKDLLPKPLFSMTCAEVVLKNQIAVGQENGDIDIVSIPNLLIGQLVKYKTLKSCSKVTALMNYKEDNVTKLLYSGHADGTVQVWNLDTAKRISTFQMHSLLVENLIKLPPTISNDPSLVVSISRDGSIAIFNSLGKTKFRFTGHTFPIQAIHWRTKDGIMMVQCLDESLHVWYMSPVRLDRVARGSQTRILLETCDASIQCNEQQYPHLYMKSKEAITAYTVTDNIRQTPMALVYQVNIKKMISDIYSGVHKLAVPKPPMESNSPIMARAFDDAERYSKKSLLKANNLKHIKNDQVAIDVSVIQSVFSCILSWKDDSQFQTQLGFQSPKTCLVGSRGANGFLTFPLEANNEWSLSPSASASRLLSILSLTRSVLSTKGLESQVSQLMTFYGTLEFTKDLTFPSLAFLAKYWQDPVVDVQQAARSLFETSFKKMSTEKREHIIQYWTPFLPSPTAPLTRSNMRATIILGIIESEYPSCLNSRDLKQVSESLDRIIHDEEGRNAYRLLAVELIGKGFISWEKHLSSADVIRYLVSQSGLSMSPTIQTGKHAALTPGLMLMARQSLINIAAINPDLFISTLAQDLANSKNSDRSGDLKLLGMLIPKKPIVLYSHLPAIVDAMVKTLDPNTPQIRESLQQIVTVNFAEMVSTFPCVDFHSGTQRLAVGSSFGPVIVYDLKSATKVQLLEGHSKPVHAVSFSPDGKLIASYSVTENCVRIFQPPTGIFGTLMGAFSHKSHSSNSHGLSASGVGHVQSFRDFNVGGPQENISIGTILEQVKFKWNTDRDVTLYSISKLELSFKV